MSDYTRPFGFTIFCDDVRAEVDGKHSFIGVYSDIMVLPSFPIQIAKFAFVVTLWEPVELALKREFPIAVNVFFPGDGADAPSMKSEIATNTNQLRSFLPFFDPEEEPSSRQFRFGVHLIAAPMVIQKPGRIKVRATYSDEILKLGSLRVTLPITPSTPQVSS